ncbi:MAG: glutaredoxin family protein [Gammaproteobacteria bacterium]|nr:glutaredoxin family protein [Gammaproteobacteria bacterium]NNM20988.1 glutaredoxin family protein [Gammaproteobacteria bacterium]
MLEAVEQLCIGHNVAVEVIDIDTDPRLAERFGLDIPVLTAGSAELCRHRLDRTRLQQWLGRS